MGRPVLDPETLVLLGLDDPEAATLLEPRAKVHYTVWLHSNEPLVARGYANDRVCGAQEMEPGGLSAHFTGFTATIRWTMIWGGDEIPLRKEPLRPTVIMFDVDRLHLTFEKIADPSGRIRRNIF